MAKFRRTSLFRGKESARRLVCETVLDARKLVLPLFVVPGKNVNEAVPSLPNGRRMSADEAARFAPKLNVQAVLLFGVIEHGAKDAEGTAALREDGPVPSAIRAILRERPDIEVMTDICLCGSTAHGHCGLLRPNGRIDVERTLTVISRMAVLHAAAGADAVAPSAMVDGQAAALREALDDAGFSQTAIVPYSAKYASSFYGPFRQAAGSTPAFGHRRSYQLPPANRREAVRKASADESEGADAIIVKPALPSLDVLAEVRRASNLPLFAYQVSGECAMIRSAAEAGVLNERAAVLETLTSIFRAGADAAITYYAQEAAEWIEQPE